MAACCRWLHRSQSCQRRSAAATRTASARWRSGWKVQSTTAPGTCAWAKLEGAPQHGEGEIAKARTVGQVVAHLEAQRRGETEGERSLRQAVVCRQGRGCRDLGRRRALSEEHLRGTFRTGRLHPSEPKPGAAGTEAGAGHALDGQHGIGLKLDRLAEEEQIEAQRPIRLEPAGAAPGFEHVGAYGPVDAAQERRRLAFDERLENPWMDADPAQPAGDARLIAAHGAHRSPQRMAERPAQHRAVIFRQRSRLLGLQGDGEAQVGDRREEVGLGHCCRVVRLAASRTSLARSCGIGRSQRKWPSCGQLGTSERLLKAKLTVEVFVKATAERNLGITCVIERGPSHNRKESLFVGDRKQSPHHRRG